MNIETKWLVDFLSLARTQSFSRSAEERHMTQPAFSRRIKALEQALGCELVDRAQVPVRLTAEGQLFQITSRNLVSQLQDCRAHLLSLRQKDAKVLDFAVSHTLSLSFFPRFIDSLEDKVSDIRCRQLVANVDDNVQALKNGICDFLLAFEDPSLDPATFERLELATEQLIPVCRADEEGNPRFNLDAGSEPQPYLGYPTQIYLGRCVDKILRNSSRSANLELTFESPLADSLKVMAVQGAGIAWVPSFAVEEEIKAGFLAVCGSAVWRLPLKICLYRCNRETSSQAQALWDGLTAQLSRPRTSGP
ncbi:LysR substrate-binding domain-containing protein [Motiliproteus sp.]|uniref:LysR substrate-binding domain-containing protein n=1 Tax=Motiliproteus sp. TaxID=1898955 RepID=UPI003BA93F2C